MAIVFFVPFAKAGDPRKVYLLAYSTEKDKGHNGLHFAWSQDKLNWNAIGPEYPFLKCDYGAWGSQKRMLEPFLFKDTKGVFHCLWTVNEQDNVLAHAESTDLVNWGRQSYVPVMKTAGLNPDIAATVRQIEVSGSGTYTVNWLNDLASGVVFTATTPDFKNYSETQVGLVEKRKDIRQRFTISGETVEGTVTEVDWSMVDNLIKNMEVAKFRQKQNSASPETDKALFAGLKPLTAEITINATQKKPISDVLMGVFFEDINYAADGGLYAELIQNNSFEYSPADKKGRDDSWNARSFWNGNFTVDTLNGIHSNNPHYAVLKNGSITNTGFDGIPVITGDKYDFSIFAKGAACTVKLVDANGTVLAQATIKPGKTWKKHSAVLKPSKTVADARLEISTSGEVAVDMVSLFPQKTFKGRKNGLRADLAQTVADLHPKFVRFPGGCVAHGDGIDNIYRWKNTVGPLENRKSDRNIWHYHQSMGLGYFEYFQFCEDIGAEPVPVLAAGVPCQNSSTGGAGQQFGIPMEHMDEYVQDVLDLIEYANGSASTKWGKVRAEAGHPKPFNLKYIGIGNEDLITDVFEERYTMIVEAVRKKYPDIIIIGTVGPFFQGTDYVEGWAIADKLQLPLVDEHYYEQPGWFINNQSFYDAYSRKATKVYLGEYASRGNTFYNALAEAIYLTGIERNGDVVSMASYAPLLAREGHTQWNPDLIYFNGTEVKPTVNYFVQKLYGENPGDEYLQSVVSLSENNDEAVKRVGISATTDTATEDVIIKLVNILPVTVTPAIELQDIKTKGNAVYTTLTDVPEGKTGRPVTIQLPVQEALKKALPPYSFTIIRIKTR
ncbi:alpha-L-arabinofuranosidase C-terminal domain-containing protein [Flavobacterium akiainvivens]|uniref:alpha-L-arabinofuranosidase C-terminal domain-containing protein n=1 Tax=Flavobacterium akiainvivens TaxID=1202724 RepID=UPI0008E2190D|nr:alpha-L-arabinofuranosidase C-terminal domain-containing protein [Flavobacterium akiainvivens]SFQ36033.1 Alpha-L-arabinofuranosidase C-terminus [Flavobacterium akiainvivens]